MAVKYNHMKAGEIEIWDRFLALAPLGQGWDWHYDVKVGDGVHLGDYEQAWVKDMAKALTQRRIDALGTRGNQLAIVEVKERAGLGAVGQLLGYRRLLLGDRPDASNALLLVVASIKGNDILKTYKENGIILVLV
jgi:hypothetical protein